MRYFLFFLSLLLFSTVYSQELRVNGSFRNSSLKKAIRHLEKEYGIYISYSTVILEDILVDVEIENSTVETAMEQLLTNTGIQYRIVKDKYIVLNKNKPIEQKIKRFAQVFAQIDLSNIYLKPAVRELVNQEKFDI